MEIFLTNDDGIHAEGLWALHRQLSRRHRVTVVAPDRERSAVGHGITLLQPLRAIRVSANGSGLMYSVNGTPVDCIKLGLLEILASRPDIVISGINPGANIGINLNYSGTVSAAKEAAIYGIPAIAVSIEKSAPQFLDDAASFIERLAETVIENGLPAGTFLNVNYPNSSLEKVRGVKITRQGIEPYSEYIEKRVDTRNMVYYWQGFGGYPHFDSPDLDVAVLSRRYISITPIQCDMTAYPLLETLRQWNLPGNIKIHRCSEEVD
jgi:5'-nucleotidase